MNKLKVGDIVVCLDNNDQKLRLTIGKVYDVYGVDSTNDPGIRDDEGSLCFYYSERFRLATLLEKELYEL